MNRVFVYFLSLTGALGFDLNFSCGARDNLQPANLCTVNVAILMQF